MKKSSSLDNNMAAAADNKVFIGEPPVHRRHDTPDVVADKNKQHTTAAVWDEENTPGNHPTSSIYHDGEQRPSSPISRPNTLPGAVAVEGPRFNTHTSPSNELEGENWVDNAYPPQEPIVAATPIHHSLMLKAELVDSCFHKYRRLLLFGSILTVIVVAIVVLATQIPPALREHELKARELEMSGLLTGLSSNESIANPSSAQYKAKEWILSEDNSGLDPKNDKNRIIQRYALAVLYYSTGGDRWIYQGNFMSSNHECDWNFVKCAINDTVTGLEIGECIWKSCLFFHLIAKKPSQQ